MRLHCATLAVLLLPWSLSLLGCGSSDARLPTAKVSGTVTLLGKPITSGTITFFPVGKGKHATGILGANGAFTLSTYEPNDGAVLGKHKVVVQVSAIGADGAPVPGAADIPSTYASSTTTPLTVEVDEFSEEISIKLRK